MQIIRTHITRGHSGAATLLEVRSEACPSQAAQAVGHFKVQPAMALSSREIECLEWLARGLLDDRIAASLGISCSTVRLHLKNARVKLGARTREQALVLALQRGLIVP